jgi:orotate phosphoribosyltransferase
METNEEELKKKCRINGMYILSSKLIANDYYDLADLYCRDPNLVLEYFRERTRGHFDCIASIELGGALIAAGLGSFYGMPVAIWRKERPLLGKPFGKVLVVDDVKTTGNSLHIVEKWVESCGAEVMQVLVGIDRSDELKDMMVLKTISDMQKGRVEKAVDLLRDALTEEVSGKINKEITKATEKWTGELSEEQLEELEDAVVPKEVLE